MYVKEEEKTDRYIISTTYRIVIHCITFSGIFTIILIFN